MGANRRNTVSYRMLRKLAYLTVMIFLAGLVFILESANERYYAAIVNYSGKVRGGIQRVVKLYFAKDFSKMKEVEEEVEDDLNHLRKIAHYLALPLVDIGKNYDPVLVKNCWCRLKKNLVVPPTEESENKALLYSEFCWTEADKQTDFYQKVVSRNLFILNTSYAVLFLISVSIIFLLVRVIIFEINRKLEKKASFDSLTGALNRATFMEIFEKLSHSKRNYPMGLIVFDLDDFKKINDTFGHSTGDKVLQDVAKTVRKHLRKTDVFVRWGGEEFAILLPQTDLEHTKRLAEKLRKYINRSCSHTCKLAVTASFGVTELLPEEALEEAFERADKALYRAKREGKNRVEVEPPRPPSTS